MTINVGTGIFDLRILMELHGIIWADPILITEASKICGTLTLAFGKEE